MQNTDFIIGDFFIKSRTLIGPRGYLTVRDGRLTFYGFKKTVTIGDLSTLHYTQQGTLLQFTTTEGKRYHFTDLDHGIRVISQKEVKELFAKVPPKDSSKAYLLTAQLIEEKLGEYEGGQYQDAKYTPAMWKVVLDASGAQAH